MIIHTSKWTGRGCLFETLEKLLTAEGLDFAQILKSPLNTFEILRALHPTDDLLNSRFVFFFHLFRLMFNLCANRLFFRPKFTTIFVRSYVRKTPHELHVFRLTQCESFGLITATFVMSVEKLPVPASIVCIGDCLPHFLNIVQRRRQHFLIYCTACDDIIIVVIQHKPLARTWRELWLVEFHGDMSLPHIDKLALPGAAIRTNFAINMPVRNKLLGYKRINLVRPDSAKAYFFSCAQSYRVCLRTYPAHIKGSAAGKTNTLSLAKRIVRNAFMRTYYVALHVRYVTVSIGLGGCQGCPVVSFAGKAQFHAFRLIGNA